MKNFKLLAIRILDNCEPHIKKCLKTKEFYYLCNDYRIENDGAKIVFASSNLKPLDEDFFWIDDNHTGPRINLSAIVGMNGDGKSSLVEVFLRIINNFSIHYEFNQNHPLQYTNVVCAECYFLHNGDFYRIQEKDTEFSINKYQYSDECYSMVETSISDDEIRKSFFYTLVSNYSVYAYNVDDYHAEYSDNKYSNPESCWLHNIFNKNDGYQVPLSLHPYRDNGLIDINNESWLSMQRLLSIYLQSDKANGLVKDKEAVAVKLKDIGYSKLQENSLKKYFKNRTEYDNLLGGRIDALDNILNQKDINDDGRKTVDDNYAFLDSFYKLFVEDYTGVITKYQEWCFNNDLFQQTDSNLKSLVSRLNSINTKFNLLKTIPIDASTLNTLCHFNMCQLLHIIYIANVKEQIVNKLFKDNQCDLSTEDFFADFKKMSEDLKCRQYLLYKILKILDTKYKNTEESFFSMFQYADDSKLAQYRESYWLEHLDELQKDWDEKSHTTLKLRQTYNHLIRIKNNNKIWYSDKEIKISELKKKSCR